MSSGGSGGSSGGATTGKHRQGPGYGEVLSFKQMEMNHMPQPVQYARRGGFESVEKDPANFPVSEYPEMIAEDTRQATRNKVVTGKGNFSGREANINYMLTDEDFKYFEAKEAAEEFAAFERWVQTCFDFKKPAEVDRFARMFPNFFERRLATIKNVADANVKYAEIVMRGPQSADDMLYLWLVQTGKIPLISGALWDPSSWSKPDKTTTKMALFNPWKVINGKEGQSMPYAIGHDGNYTYPGIPMAVGAGTNGGYGEKDQGKLYNEMFVENTAQGYPGTKAFKDFFTK